MIVVGGGPAGAATAITLSRLGLRTTVLEAAPEPQWKPGESLAPSINPVLTRLGLGATMRRGPRCPRTGSVPAGVCRTWSNATSSSGPAGMAGGSTGSPSRPSCRGSAAGRWSGAGGAGSWAAFGQRGVGACGLRPLPDPAPGRHGSSWMHPGRAARVARLLGARRVRYDRLIGALTCLPSSEGPTGPEDDESTTVVEAIPGGW